MKFFAALLILTLSSTLLAGDKIFLCPDDKESETFALVVLDAQDKPSSVVINARSPSSSSLTQYAFNCGNISCYFKGGQTGYIRLMKFDKELLSAVFMTGRNYEYESSNCKAL